MILGPTASGKTQLACALAAKLNGEIISADSRQVYRNMDIGTGKDLSEYQIGDKKIPYHLIDIKDPGYKYNIAEFQLDFLKAFSEITSRNNLPILCGGSGLYLETALRGNSFLGIPPDESFYKKVKQWSIDELDAALNAIPINIKEKLGAQTEERKVRMLEIANFLAKNPDWKPVDTPNFNETIIGINVERELRRTRITKRLKDRLENGMIEEVQNLIAQKISSDVLESYGLEYKYVTYYLQNKISKAELFEQLNIAIHQFAKRQMTWFRRMETRGFKINWIDSEMGLEDKVSVVKERFFKRTE